MAQPKKDGMKHAGRMRRLQAATKSGDSIRLRYTTLEGRRITRTVKVVEMRGDTVWVQDETLKEEPKSLKKVGVKTAHKVRKKP